MDHIGKKIWVSKTDGKGTDLFIHWLEVHPRVTPLATIKV